MARRLSILPLAIAVLVLASSATPPAAEKRPVTFDDLMKLKAAGSPTISPDGAWVLFTVRQWEGPEDKKEARTQVWRVATAGGEPAQMTFDERGASSPAWSPDGRFISFVSSRGAGAAAGADEGPRPQIWIMRSDGGEAWKLTDAKEGVGGYAWAPDAKRIAYVARDPLPKDAEDRRKKKDDARVFEGDFRYSHVWTIDVASKKAEALTSGTAYTVSGAPCWSPDGARLAFTASPTTMVRDERADIYVLTVGTKSAEKVTTNPGRDGSPAWSPDGKTLAFVFQPADAKPHADGILPSSVRNSRLGLLDVATKTIKDASSPAFDLSPGDPRWLNDGRLLFATGNRAFNDVFVFDVASGRYEAITEGRLISIGSLTKDRSRVAFLMQSPAEPGEVYVSDVQFTAPRRLSRVNPQAADFALGDTDFLTWRSGDGVEVEGVLLKPVGFDPARRYPLLVVVHGGPTGAHTAGVKLGVGDAGQHWAGQGWAVLYPNPRGSTNYGEKFMRGNIPDWGGGDYRDIMAGVDAVIKAGVADPDRLAVMGWSYGGYMTCWIVSQTSRFKAAMMGAGLSDLVSMYGTTDIPGYIATFFQGFPTFDAAPATAARRETRATAARTKELYESRSGLTFADRVTTPLLILHGGSDERVPIGQPMEFYRALKDRGKTVELVFYPREGHGLSEYYHQLDRMKRQYEWIVRHTLGKVPTTPN